MKFRTQGFTIIEVLVAMALFAIVVLVVLAPLTGLFGLTQKSNQQATATNIAQQALETIRGQWLNSNNYRYDINCVAGPLTTSGVTPTVSIQDEDVQGNDLTSTRPFTVGTATTCPASPGAGGAVAAGPPMREITVTATVNGVSSRLVVEVAR